MIVTVVGSYPKIPEGEGPHLRRAINQLEAGQITPAELEQVVARTIERVIREQEQCGVELVTDGQIRWDDLVTPSARDLGSVEVGGLVRYFDTNVYYRRPVIKGRLWFRGSSLAFEVAQAVALARRPVKAVLPGPFTFAQLSLDQHYGRLQDLVMDVASCLNLEARALARAGCAMVQFDEPALVFGAGRDDVALARQALAVAVEGVGVPTALYTYFRSAEPLVGELAEFPADVVGLDVVSGPGVVDRLAAGGFPKGVALGVVDGREWRLEPADEVARLVERVAAGVGWNRLYLNPSCGLEFLPQNRAMAKLRRLREAADLVLGRRSAGEAPRPAQG